MLLVGLGLFVSLFVNAQTFEGTVRNKDTNEGLENVLVTVVETDGNLITTNTDSNGVYSITSADSNEKTLRFELYEFMFEEIYHVQAGSGIDINLRPRRKSAASIREESYIEESCSNVNIPDDPDWNINFVQTELKGDLAPDKDYTRRDPSAVIKVGDLYYMWYSYSLTVDDKKTAPWDYNDLYYATSSDGITWDEKGAAVERGPEGSYDHRSVFTTEVFVHDGRYYLIYQAAADYAGVYGENTVAMAYADSPDGPWTKLEEPVLRPSYTEEDRFDKTSVHDPCVVVFNGKFHLYYKGECNQGQCNKICDLRKQVKWGVAIADSPTGPYVKIRFKPDHKYRAMKPWLGLIRMVWRYYNIKMVQRLTLSNMRQMG